MANGLVEYSIEAKPEIKSIFESVGVPTPAFNQLKKNNKQSMDAFKNAISKAKQSLGNNGASVELKDDYTDINLYLSDDGESGFGIKPNGDIVSVFSNSKEKGRSSYMLEMAISQGGRQLDCFDIYLTKIYEAHGFKPVAKMKWNDEYIPEGWNKDNFKDYNNGEPDVVFMAYDPNNDIEKQHESLEDTMEEIEKKRGYRYKRKTREEKIPYIIDYDDGEKFQHQYKWRSPAEREAIYNNMLKRYKNAKTTEELKKVVFDNDKPLEVFNRQLDDLGSLSKEQAQSIRAEYSKRYLELIKDENPEEYKKNKKYLEKKYNIKSDAGIYIDSLIDTIAYIDAKKKEFKEEDVDRDEDGKFAKKGTSSNKSKDNDKKENSNPKKSNCNIGDTYNIAINDMATIPAKKIAESNSYELYDEKDYFNKLNSKKKQDLENALQYASEKYDELFNIYGLSDSQPTNKLKVVLISQKDYKDMKGAAGFTLRAGSSEEDSNNIFVNIDTIKKNDMNYINEVFLHETTHAIINDNLRNAKTNERPSKILEEALAETATFIANDKNYRDTDNPKALLFNKYYFTSNLMHYFYLKNNKNSDIFKDIIEKRQTGFMDAVQDIGNKVGIQGSKADIIKQFLKDKCNITDSDATMFILDLERKIKNPNW